MGGYTVDPVELRGCDARLGTAASHARSALGLLRSCTAQLLAGWGGPAAEQFESAWQQWSDAVTALLDALDAMASELGRSGDGYALTDDAVRRSVAGAVG